MDKIDDRWDEGFDEFIGRWKTLVKTHGAEETTCDLYCKCEKPDSVIRGFAHTTYKFCTKCKKEIT